MIFKLSLYQFLPSFITGFPKLLYTNWHAVNRPPICHKWYRKLYETFSTIIRDIIFMNKHKPSANDIIILYNNHLRPNKREMMKIFCFYDEGKIMNKFQNNFPLQWFLIIVCHHNSSEFMNNFPVIWSISSVCFQDSIYIVHVALKFLLI